VEEHSEATAMTDTLPRLLTVREVLALVRVSRPTLWKMRAAGAFPSAIRISPNRIAWTETAIRDWLAKRPAA